MRRLLASRTTALAATEPTSTPATGRRSAVVRQAGWGMMKPHKSRLFFATLAPALYGESAFRQRLCGGQGFALPER